MLIDFYLGYFKHVGIFLDFGMKFQHDQFVTLLMPNYLK